MNPEIITIGEIIVDMVSNETDCGLEKSSVFTKAGGGAGANVAAGIAKLGMNSSFIGKVGKDPFGDFLINSLNNCKVNTSQIIRDKRYRSTLAIIANRSDGKKDIFFYRNPGADMMLEKSEINESHIKQASLLHFGSFSLSKQPMREATFYAVKSAKKHGLTISFDPNVRTDIWNSKEEIIENINRALNYADIVKIADEEWHYINDKSIEDGCQDIINNGASIVVVTFGKKGAYYKTKNESGKIKAFEVNSIDSLGAGDSFIASLLYQFTKNKYLNKIDSLSKKQLESAIRFSCACGAITTLKKGVIPSLPSLKEANEFLKRKNNL